VKDETIERREFQIERKIMLLRANLSEADVARMLKVTRQSVNRVMTGKITSRRIAEALCQLTKTPYEKFFPETVKKKEAAASDG